MAFLLLYWILLSLSWLSSDLFRFPVCKLELTVYFWEPVFLRIWLPTWRLSIPGLFPAGCAELMPRLPFLWLTLRPSGLPFFAIDELEGSESFFIDSCVWLT